MRKYGILLFLLIILSQTTWSQKKQRVLFYNVENLFDTKDDKQTKDDEFTPWGDKHWTREKYFTKLKNIARVIEEAGGGEWPLLVGMSEVENHYVLEDLVHKTCMAEGKYSIIHQDSPDERGIDVALLYRGDDIRMIDKQFLTLNQSYEHHIKSRDILYATGVSKNDTLHIFVCHFPSMRGGEKQSEWKRMAAAKTLRTAVDTIYAQHTDPAILIMGDMNSQADRKAIQYLCPYYEEKEYCSERLYNLGYYLLSRANQGSYRYRGNWQTIDHIIVSGSLLNGNGAFHTQRRLCIFSAPFLLEKDKTHFGFRPLPTYRGPLYIGGYSDHLPVYIDIWKDR